jgi:hypothetical protein
MNSTENTVQEVESHVVPEDRNENRVDMKAGDHVKRTHSPVCELRVGGWCAPEDEIPKGGWRGPEDEIPKGGWR